MADEITTEDILRQYGPQQSEKKDEHGFLFSNIGGQLKFNPWESIKGLMSYRGAPGHLSTSGDLQPIRDAADTAGWVGMPGLGLNYAGVMPTNIVGAAGGKLASKAATELPARELDPLGFYSAALEGAKTWPMERGSPSQALAHLKKSGTKDAEISATGLDKYLAEQDVVTRQAMEDYLRQNRVQLKENKYGGNEAAQEKWLEQAREREIENTLGEYEIRQDPDGYWRTYLYNEPLSRRGHTSEGAAEDMLRETVHSDILGWSDRELRERGFGDRASKQEELLWPSDVKDKAKWQEYSLDTENPTYRESVMHLPGSGKMPDFETWKGNRRSWGHDDPTADAAALRSEYDRRVREGVKTSDDFASGHWNEPNVVAHMRTSIQPDEAGRPTFLIDELQSDWGQRLREEGARDPRKMDHLQRVFHERGNAHDAAADNAINFINQHKAELDTVRNKSQFGTPYDLMALADRGSTADIQAEARAILEKFNNTERALKLADAEMRTAEAAAPGHPLVNTTDQWTTTGIRRLLQQAADADAAGIALTPGQLQNERFNLARHVAGLRYSPDAQSLHYKQPGGADHWYSHRGDVKPQDLPSIVGKEMAAKLLEQPLAPFQGGGNYQAHTLTDLGRFEIGGNGMRYSYDKMYPKKIEQILRKLDPQHPGASTTKLRPHDSDSPTYSEPFHYFPLTDTVRKEIKKGLPLFSAGLPVASLLEQYYGPPRREEE